MSKNSCFGFSVVNTQTNTILWKEAEASRKDRKDLSAFSLNVEL